MNPDDKPITMPLRDWLIKRIAISKNIPSAVIESIVSHQFDSANAATYLHKSLEISGFGRFTFSDAKAKSQMSRYGDMLLHLNVHLRDAILDKDKLVIQEKIDNITKAAKELKKRL